ncbi:MAG: hypothetical protein AAF384_04640 [Pseudomonadota bacterium]
MAWFDYVGLLGVVLILIAYYLLQAEKLSSLDLNYSVMNLIGASLITLSLLFDFNFSAFVIEVCWVLISLYGITKYFRARARA